MKFLQRIMHSQLRRPEKTILAILKKNSIGIETEKIAFLTSLLLAISPWHIQFSRTGFEANTGLFFVVLAGVFFFRFINKKKQWNLFLSLGIFAYSIYFYRSIWVFVPLLLVSLFLIYRKDLFSKVNLKKSLIGIILFF